MKASTSGLLDTSAMPWVLGATVVLLGYSSDFWLTHLMSNEMYEIADDLLLGIIVGVIGTWWLRKRNRAIKHKLNRVANINHLIRNELEVILYSAHTTSNVKDIKHIEQSVGQISWILRELLGPDYVVGVENNSATHAQSAARSESKTGTGRA